jgi:CelD/BcsL family acetyltransferase involved in cellulose biosynthesis
MFPDESYEVSLWRNDFESSLLRQPWELLSRQRESVTAFYQSPRYFDYLQDSEPESRFDIMTVNRGGTGTVVGVVPLKVWTYRLRFALLSRTFIDVGLKSTGIIGSEPMLPEDPAAFDSLFLSLVRRYPESQIFYMDAVPATSYLWRHLRTSPAIRRHFHRLVLDGFRESHSVPVPTSVDAYQKTLSRKKRYNLKRQERLLEAHCGQPLRMLVITEEKDLRELFDAIKQLPATKKRDFVFREAAYMHLSRYEFLHCYILKSGDDVLAVLLGIKAGKTLKTTGVFHDLSLDRYSPGTTLWHRALTHLIGFGEFTQVDFGCGFPAYRHRSTNIIEQKGQVLLFRRSIVNRCLVLAYSCFSSAVKVLRTRTQAANSRE